jgi:putative NADH-flavin reductase
MSTTIAKPVKVAIIGASGTYGKGILARAEEIGVEVVVVTRSPHKFKDVKPTTTVGEAQLDEEEKLKRRLRAAMASSRRSPMTARRVRRRTTSRTSGRP